jgi:putative flippase GtrA
MAYLCSIAWQMELHARLVFHTPVTNYLNTLLQAYLVYGVSIALSTVMNAVLVDTLGANHTVAFLLGLGVTGVLNYFFVSNIMEGEAQRKSTE